MSGHSKWAGIKHKKALVDAQRSRVFTKLIRELTVAAREGGGDLEANPKLRAVAAKAREANMPIDNMERAIKRGTGELPGVTYEEITYEGYGPGGVAILVETLTDNKNRASGEIRSLFSRRGGNLAGAGSVAWMFQKKGYFLIEKSRADEDRVMTLALDAGAEDFNVGGEAYEITTQPQDFEAVKKALADAGVACQSADLTMVPSSSIKVTGADAKQVLALMEALEEHDDVQHVYANFDIPDDILKAFAAEGAS